MPNDSPCQIEQGLQRKDLPCCNDQKLSANGANGANAGMECDPKVKSWAQWGGNKEEQEGQVLATASHWIENSSFFVQFLAIFLKRRIYY